MRKTLLGFAMLFVTNVAIGRVHIEIGQHVFSPALDGNTALTWLYCWDENISAASVTTPKGEIVPLLIDDDGDWSMGTQLFPNLAAMDERFPAGIYVFSMVYANGTTNTIPIDVNKGYPSANPDILHPAEGSTIEPGDELIAWRINADSGSFEGIVVGLTDASDDPDPSYDEHEYQWEPAITEETLQRGFVLRRDSQYTLDVFLYNAWEDHTSAHVYTFSRSRGARAIFTTDRSIVKPVIVSIDNGYLSFTNVHPDLYYTIEYRPNLIGTDHWDGDYQRLRSIQANESIISVPVGVFYRVIGHEYPNPAAAVPQTGQTASYRTGDDGNYHKGVEAQEPRFIVITNGINGLVRDNLTGLIWTQRGDLTDEINWFDAVDYCNELVYGGHDDWRLPNVRELLSLIDYGRHSPALPDGHPFTGLISEDYWTSTTYPGDIEGAYRVYISDGLVDADDKLPSKYHVWPVRGGQ